MITLTCRLLMLISLVALGACTYMPLYSVGPDAHSWRFSPSAQDQFKVFQQIMLHPAKAAVLADALLVQTRIGRDSAAALGTIEAPLSAEIPNAASRWAMLSLLSERAREKPPERSSPSPALVPLQLDSQATKALLTLPPDLQEPVLAQLQAMLAAQALLEQALRSIPYDITRSDLLQGQVNVHQLAQLAPQVDLPVLHRAMQTVLRAVHALNAHLQALGPRLPVGIWRHHTAWGWIHIDTTGQSGSQDPQDVWLWIKTGGDDNYSLDDFHGQDRRAVRVLLDTGGNDRYHSRRGGADASSGILGLSVLWDAAGDDTWQCTQWCQASALLGAAALVNQGGNDYFQAHTQAQGFAVGGLALLLSEGSRASGSQTTRYNALSDSQGSAGPSGVAVLLDTHGDDDYTLSALPLVAPSAQLPERNHSTGQGMGRGWRLLQDGREVLATAGGVGVLIDLQGNDHYSAQVFAQGAGYHEGLGLLIDGDGHNTHEAAWYALGAAAHGGAGVFVASGVGDDVYRISHVTALGAGHDASVGWFEDRGGNDHYSLGDMGLGISSDGGSGFFLDRGGADCFEGQTADARVQGRRVWLQHPPRLRAGVAVFRHEGRLSCGQLRP